MASPPFTLNITIPGDTDIVSQFPGVDRTHIDILNSWLKTDHNVNGTHNFATFLQVGVADGGGSTASAPSPASNNSALYRDTDGALKIKRGEDSTVEFMGGVPPGAVVAYGGSTLPVGWKWCDGTAISRSTYARLFTAIGTNFGTGDGSTTFNVPDLNGRVIIGRDRTSTGRITSAVSGIDGTVLAAAGGEQGHVLVIGELAAHTHSITDPGHTHIENFSNSGPGSVGISGVSNSSGTPGASGVSTASGSTGITATNSTGSDTAHNNVQPSLVMNYIIRS